MVILCQKALYYLQKDLLIFVSRTIDNNNQPLIKPLIYSVFLVKAPCNEPKAMIFSLNLLPTKKPVRSNPHRLNVSNQYALVIATLRLRCKPCRNLGYGYPTNL